MLFVKSEEDCQEFIAGDETILSELIHPENDPIKVNYSLAKARLKPNSYSRPHKLKHSEVYYVLDGKGTAVIDHNKIEIEKGSILFVPPDTEQYLINSSDSELVFLCIVEPYWRSAIEVITDNL